MGVWQGPVWIAGLVVPLVLWGGVYGYYKKIKGVQAPSAGFQSTGFAPLSQPLTADNSQAGIFAPAPAAGNIASPDWNTAAPTGGAASL